MSPSNFVLVMVMCSETISVFCSKIECGSHIVGCFDSSNFQNRFRFTGECSHPDAFIKSCQQPGNQFLITNQKFNISYKKCDGMEGTFDGLVEYSCLGDWFVDKNHFFAVANTKESRKDEKYRYSNCCLLETSRKIKSRHYFSRVAGANDSVG